MTDKRTTKGKQRDVGDRERQQHLILSFKSFDDPSPETMARVRAAVQNQSAARIVRERPGMLRIAVAKGDLEKIRTQLQALEEWDVSEEAQASMPTGTRPTRSTK